MTDPNNIPQEAQQLKKDIARADAKSSDRANTAVTRTDFDQEYEMAQNNNNGSGTQSSDPNPVNRKDASVGSSASSGGADESSGKVGHINSPGDSDPDDYLDMAKDITENVNAE